MIITSTKELNIIKNIISFIVLIINIYNLYVRN